MRPLLILTISLMILQPVQAQVDVDTIVRATGPLEQRGVDGIAEPSTGTAVITVEGGLRAGFTWATATAQGNLITLNVDPALDVLTDGTLLRFVAPATQQGIVNVQVGTFPAMPVTRPDGMPPAMGQLVAGRICEVLHANGRFILLNASETGCPPGTLPINDRVCMETTSISNILFHTAVDRCSNRGGKLCTWDEYYAGCTLLGSQLSSLFNEWEWIDDTSNHTHGANQAGRFSCMSVRTQGVLDERVGDVRCCFHPR